MLDENPTDFVVQQLLFSGVQLACGLLNLSENGESIRAHIVVKFLAQQRLVHVKSTTGVAITFSEPVQ